jgi:hypothetical protein
MFPALLVELAGLYEERREFGRVTLTQLRMVSCLRQMGTWARQRQPSLAYGRVPASAHTHSQALRYRELGGFYAPKAATDRLGCVLQALPPRERSADILQGLFVVVVLANPPKLYQ